MRWFNLCFIGLVFILLVFQSCNEKETTWQFSQVGFSDHFHDIEFVSRSEAIAYSYGSGLVVRTIDQGKTWSKVLQTDSIYYEQIDFPSEKIGFICGNTNNILKTTNAGRTWQTIKIDSIPENAPVYGMVFQNINIGYISVIGSVNNTIQTKLLKTIDSGNTWQLINVIPEMILNLKILEHKLYGSGNNVLIQNINQKNYKVIYKDEDAQVGQIRDFTKFGEQYIMASFNGYIITGSTNNFIKQQLTKNRFRSMVIFSDETLYVAGDGEIANENMFMSRDKGRHWTNISKDSTSIHRLAVRNGLAYGVGKNDLLMKLNNK